MKHFIVSFVAIYIFGFCTADVSNNHRNETTMDVLKRDILVNYDRYARPAEFNTSTKISIGLNIKHIDLDELKGSMTIYGWVAMVWTDPNLVWDPKDYDGIAEIHMPGHEIWQPDLSAFNSASDSVDHYGNTLSILKSDGYVLWVPPAQFNVFCEFDFRMWPFDSQKCSLSLGSWSYTASDVELNYTALLEESIERYIENNLWSIKSINVSKEINDCCLKPFQSIRYDIVVERRSPMYKTIVITPASCVILLTLSCFWLPAQTGEKILLNGINIIMIFAFMMYFAQMLPVLAVSTPLVVLFYSSSLLLVSISMIASVIVIYLANTTHQKRVPMFLKNVLYGPFGTVLCLFHMNTHRQKEVQDKELQDDNFESHAIEEEHPAIDQEPPKQSIQHDWLVFATAIDRILFLIYCIVFIVLAVTYSV